MPNQIIPRKSFLDPAKRLSRKYRSFQTDLARLINELRSNAEVGIPLGGGVYKIRLGIRSKGRGKSGGARVITYFYRTKERVYLVLVYDKSDAENVEEIELRRLITELEVEIE